MTPAERKALAFLTAVAALGAGARAAGLGAPPPPVASDDPAADERRALDRQLAAVDSARASRRTTGRRRRADDRPVEGRPADDRPAEGRSRRRRADAGAAAPAGTVALTPQPLAADTRFRAPVTASMAGGAAGAPVDVDRADSAALVALPGIGPALARRIVADRAGRGPFGSVDGLSRVAGIGPRLEARLRPLVTFSGRAAAVPLPGPPSP